MKKSELKQIIKEELEGRSLGHHTSLGDEYIERMEGVTTYGDVNKLKTTLRSVVSDWRNEGYEDSDIMEYLAGYISTI